MNLEIQSWKGGERLSDSGSHKIRVSFSDVSNVWWVSSFCFMTNSHSEHICNTVHSTRLIWMLEIYPMVIKVLSLLLILSAGLSAVVNKKEWSHTYKKQKNKQKQTKPVFCCSSHVVPLQKGGGSYSVLPVPIPLTPCPGLPQCINIYYLILSDRNSEPFKSLSSLT